MVDQHEVVQECQCECAVGQGPTAHCKHVATNLYALTKFCESGELITEMTCTQVRQKFHQTKSHKGSPLKMSNLPDVLEKNNGPKLFDPRTSQRIVQQIQNHSDNTILNWPNRVSRLPYLQRVPSARLCGVGLHRDFSQVSMVDKLRNEKLEVITEEKVREIEESTRGQSSSRRSKMERDKRITASNFGMLYRAKEKKNYAQKLLHPPNIGMCKPTQHGRKYESIARKKFEEENGVKTESCGLFVSQLHPMLAASPYAVIGDDKIAEIKFQYSAWEYEINGKTVPYLQKTLSGYKLKEEHPYFYQCQGQLFCSKRKLCKFIVFTSKDILIVDVPMDDLSKFYEETYRDALLNKYLWNSEDSYF